MKVKYKKITRTHAQTYGCVISTNDSAVAIEFCENITSSLEGKLVSVGVPTKRKTASGMVISVLDIIAYGKISSVEKHVIIINSNRNSPIIAKKTLGNCVGKACELMITMLNDGVSH